MNPDIRLIALDLDGTTVGKSNQVTPAVLRAIAAARQQGVEVAIATGRMYRSALRFYRDMGLSSPLMTYQGALIKDPATDETLRHWTVNRQDALQLLDYFEQPDLRDRLSVHFYVNDDLYVREVSQDTRVYASRSGIQPIAVGDLRSVETEPTKILALCENPDLIDQLLISLRALYPPEQLYFTKSVATFFEATNPKVNKGTAVRYLAEELLGLQSHQVMAIGDNFNDLEMITYAGIGIAMGDAPPEVKAAANWVAPEVEADGVAEAIAKFVLH